MLTHNDQGGIVSIPTNTNRWPTFNRKNAEELMTRACPEGFVIESEGEVPIGPQPATPITPQKKSTYNVVVSGVDNPEANAPRSTEYQIRFRSRNARNSVTPVKAEEVTTQGIIPLLPPSPAESAIQKVGAEVPQQSNPINR